jgi:hypothetical protein
MGIGKSAHELQVFSEFTRSAGLIVVLESIETCEPPSPDIKCIVDNGYRYFELGRILDEEIPKLRIEMLRQAPQPVKPDPPKFGWPERNMLIQKLSSQYETHGLPVDLVLYWDFDNRNWLTANEPPPIAPFSDMAEDLLTPQLISERHPFSRIFYFHRRIHRILWRYPNIA